MDVPKGLVESPFGAGAAVAGRAPAAAAPAAALPPPVLISAAPHSSSDAATTMAMALLVLLHLPLFSSPSSTRPQWNRGRSALSNYGITYEPGGDCIRTVGLAINVGDLYLGNAQKGSYRSGVLCFSAITIGRLLKCVG